MRRGVKVVAALALIYTLQRNRPVWRPEIVNRTGLDYVPLLEQPVNREFNQANVWVSMTLCYTRSIQPHHNRDAVIRAVLATRLWRETTGANIVLQVFNDTEIQERDLASLGLIQSSGSQVVMSGDPGCDCGLGHSVARVLLHTVPGIKEQMHDKTIVVISNVGAFLSKGEIMNVLQSGHKTWMFNAEAVFYGHQPFPTNFIAMTVDKWKTITYDSQSCSELVNKDDHIGKEYETPEGHTEIMLAVTTMEKFITRRSLLLGHCTVPDWNNVWSSLGAEAGFNPNLFDRDVCWKGMGMAACSNTIGYWHYPDMPGCGWWTDQFPAEIFHRIVKKSDPLAEIIKETSILFTSN